MASPSQVPSNADQNGDEAVVNHNGFELAGDAETTASDSSDRRSPPTVAVKTPEPPTDQRAANGTGPSTPEAPPSFDWDEFEARYQEALRGADEKENEIIKEAEALSQYFQAWASAAAVHDNERANKRLQTRRRFVNLSEESLSQKQQHYEEVVRAFESALALLRSR